VAQPSLQRPHAAICLLTDFCCLVSRHYLLALQPVSAVKSQMNTILFEYCTDVFVDNNWNFFVSSQQLRYFNHEVHHRVRVGLYNPEEGG
jgi:hypothetical protein